MTPPRRCSATARSPPPRRRNGSRERRTIRISRATPSPPACARRDSRASNWTRWSSTTSRFSNSPACWKRIWPWRPAAGGLFPTVMSNWLGEKLDLRNTIREELPDLRADCPILFTAHHQAHAASAFYPSPFTEAAILTIDGVGEWATTTIGIGRGRGNRIARRSALSAFARAALFGVHGLLRIPHQFRRIQIDGPRALRRAEICRCHPRESARPESRTARSG